MANSRWVESSGLRVNWSNNNQLLALLVLIKRSAEPDSWHKCAQIHGLVAFCRLCLNALHCHEKALVGTVASFLLMSSCGRRELKPREFLSSVLSGRSGLG